MREKLQAPAKATIREIESFRPDKDVAALLAVTLGKHKLNKNRLMNACVRHALAKYAGKRIVLDASDRERAIFSEGAK